MVPELPVPAIAVNGPEDSFTPKYSVLLLRKVF
jgi:hypothetical protein